MSRIEELRALIGVVHLDQLEWELFPPHVSQSVFGAHVDEDGGGPCRITTGDLGFDDEEALHLAVAAVNAVPATLRLFDAVSRVLADGLDADGAHEELRAAFDALDAAAGEPPEPDPRRKGAVG